MDRKIVFLDIDGTLVNLDGKIAESTKNAIEKAKRRGHEMVLCTGRSFYQVFPSLWKVGFDGIVGGAGVFVKCKEKEICHYYFNEDKRKKLFDYLEKNQFIYTVQTDTGTFVNSRCAEAVKTIFQGRELSKEQMDIMLNNLMVRDDLLEYEHEEKVVYQRCPFPLEKVKKDLSPEFYITGLSIGKLQEYSGEIGIGGINKSTGMQAYMDYAGFDRVDSIAVGDGPNDVEMIQYAKIGVAMGNASMELKECADLITTSIDEDGIYHAFEWLRLI